MAFGGTDQAADHRAVGLGGLRLDLLLTTILRRMTHLATVVADGDATVELQSSAGKVLQVLLRGLRPALREERTGRVRGPVEDQQVLLVRDAVHADEDAGLRNLDLLIVLETPEILETYLGDEVHPHVLRTEAILEIDEVDRVSREGAALAVGEEGSLEVIHVALLVSDDHGLPGYFDGHLGMTGGEHVHTRFLARALAVTCD
jgi:hypothetical protein